MIGTVRETMHLQNYLKFVSMVLFYVRKNN